MRHDRKAIPRKRRRTQEGCVESRLGQPWLPREIGCAGRDRVDDRPCASESPISTTPMCGRYTDTRRKRAMLVRLGAQADMDFTPRYNIAPTQDVWIVAQAGDGTPELRRARWGLIPFWAADEKSGS